MDWQKKLNLYLKSLLSKPKFRLGLQIVAALIVLLLLTEVGFNIWLRNTLRGNLIGTGPGTRLNAAVSWLSVPDVLSGRVGWVDIDSRNCYVGRLRFNSLKIKSKGFSFKPLKLLRENTVEFTKIGRTEVAARVAAADLQAYLNEKYHNAGLGVSMLGGKLRFTGIAPVFGSKVPFTLDGALLKLGEQQLRFYPQRLLLGKRVLPPSFLKFLGEQVPLQFNVLENWPLRITGLQLTDGFLALTLREIELKKGSG